MRADLKISGFASVFGRPDLAGDEIKAGAFHNTLAARPPGDIKMLFQHDLVRPIGRWSRFVETRGGLWVEGLLNADVQLAREVAALIDQGAINGLSIGFKSVHAERAKGRVRRRLLQVDLVEVSVVTFPMQPLAKVALT